jgi:hypothetical protein
VISYTWLAGFAIGDYSIVAAIKYQVQDQTAQPIKATNMEPQEKILQNTINGVNYGDSQATWRDIGPTAYPGTSKMTDSNGQFLDARRLANTSVF